MAKTVIVAASYYNKKCFFSDEFTSLPVIVKNELKKMVIDAADKSKGIFSIGFDEFGDVLIETGGVEDDIYYDEIEGKLQIKQIEKEQAELLNKIYAYNKIKQGQI